MKNIKTFSISIVKKSNSITRKYTKDIKRHCMLKNMKTINKHLKRYSAWLPFMQTKPTMIRQKTPSGMSEESDRDVGKLDCSSLAARMCVQCPTLLQFFPF